MLWGFLPVLAMGLLLAACAPQELATPPAGVEKGAGTPAKGPERSWQEEWDKLVAAAQKEGMVSIYDQWGPAARVQLTRAFKTRYGIDLEFTSVGKGSELLPKLTRERQAGLYLADIIGAGATTLLLEEKPAGILAPVEPLLVLPDVKDPGRWLGNRLFVDGAKLVVGMSADFQRQMARNTDMVKEGELKSYMDLLDPRWKGKIILNDPTVSGAGNSWVAILVNAWGLEQTRGFLGKLVKQEPVVSRDLRLQVEWLARGKYPLVAAVHKPTLVEFMQMGAPVATVPVKEGGSVTQGAGAFGVPAGRLPHPNAAVVFANWLLTNEGQTVFAKGYSRPSSRLDVSKEGFIEAFPEPGEAFTLDNEETIALKGQLLEISKQVLAPLLK
ncbi:MAG: extracellular solute-binding protein [Chloroflexi bacterium]|nr:extracellular solute-binding protein [Chloroflexota bacterium]